ncbi:MAG: ribosomal protein S18-alanine N-acetyltransferase [Myxococcota bacterium]|nr:ribosomal protein S18-alanine N-acetyltransferase [Myxococcota bacterium]
MHAAIRNATDGDVDRLVALESVSGIAERTAEAYKHELSLTWSRVLVLEVPDVGVVACAIYWVIEDEVELHWITVHPEHRRLGLARKLIDAMRDDAQARSARRVLLEVRRSNATARGLYRACGFGEIGVRAGYYQGDGEDAIVMELLLPRRP